MQWNSLRVKQIDRYNCNLSVLSFYFSFSFYCVSEEILDEAKVDSKIGRFLCNRWKKMKRKIICELHAHIACIAMQQSAIVCSHRRQFEPGNVFRSFIQLFFLSPSLSFRYIQNDLFRFFFFQMAMSKLKMPVAVLRLFIFHYFYLSSVKLRRHNERKELLIRFYFSIEMKWNETRMPIKQSLQLPQMNAHKTDNFFADDRQNVIPSTHSIGLCLRVNARLIHRRFRCRHLSFSESSKS